MLESGVGDSQREPASSGEEFKASHWLSLRNDCSFPAKADWSPISHSQTTFTAHPSFLSLRKFFRSRRRFSVNFGNQKANLDLGTLARPQLECRCQKQPWTKITFFRPGKTKSGLPGRSERCSRYLYPNLKTNRRTSSSGLVSRFRIRDILWLRSLRLSVSITILIPENLILTLGCCRWVPHPSLPFLRSRGVVTILPRSGSQSRSNFFNYYMNLQLLPALTRWAKVGRPYWADVGSRRRVVGSSYASYANAGILRFAQDDNLSYVG